MPDCLGSVWIQLPNREQNLESRETLETCEMIRNQSKEIRYDQCAVQWTLALSSTKMSLSADEEAFLLQLFLAEEEEHDAEEQLEELAILIASHSSCRSGRITAFTF